MAITQTQLERALKIRASMDTAIETVAETAGDNPDSMIRLMDMVRPWAPGPHAYNEVRKHQGKLYRCEQAHDSTGNPAWSPDQAPALWPPYHGRTAETALPWQKPTGAHDMYKAGEYMTWTDGIVYACLANTDFSPEEYPSAWQAQ